MRTIATAGHVDHGKSALVRALTGTDPDRFPEEKARGLTIDLGFAFTTLPSGTEIGFVDVPGHVRFIKNMLAGVGAVDVALLVVAANEGWMPQTEEHLRILELLGVDHALVAIAKADLVDDDLLELAALEVSDHLAGTTLASAPAVVCDSLSGRGVDDVRRALDDVLASAPAARDTGRPRLWIDRVFAAKGAGTVVTGTLTGGAIHVDDELDVAGRGRRVRVRGIETAGRRAQDVAPGGRVALNLAGIDHHELRRGDALVRPGQWMTPTVVDVAIRSVPGARLIRRGRVQVYAGSGEHGAVVRVLDPDGRFARLRFDHALPLAPGDRLVLRDPGRACTIAGAEVLDVDPVRRVAEALLVLDLPLGARLVRAHHWIPLADLGRLAGLDGDDLDHLVAALVAEGTADCMEGWLVDRATLTSLRDAARARVDALHRAEPNAPGIDVHTLARALRLDIERVHAVVDGMPDVVVERGVVRDAGHTSSVLHTDEGRAVVAKFAASPYAPPAPDDAGAPLALVRALVREGELVDVDGVVFAASALDAARDVVVALLAEKGTITVADVRDALHTSRKFTLPIVNWLDRNGVTRRRGDDRIPGPASGIA